MLSDWQNLLRGFLSLRDNGDGTRTPLRFTAGQLAFYKADPGYRIRTQASAGICLDCVTDARRLTLTGEARPGSSQDLWGFDLLLDGRLAAHREGSVAHSPRLKLEFDLPEGVKRLQLMFPCLAETRIRDLALSGGSFARPAPSRMRLLCLGDSITQGYTVRFPCSAYASALALALDAELLNQAVAGETFQPGMLADAPALRPDLITVAYGTNDWNCKSPEALAEDAAAFFARLRALWPEAPLAVVTPIWRADALSRPERWPFAETDARIRAAAQAYQAKGIAGRELFPAVPELMADGVVHPNDLGHRLYAARLTARLHALGLAQSLTPCPFAGAE